MVKAARLGYSHTNPIRASAGGLGGVVHIPDLGELPDVDVSTPPNDGDVLVWDDGTETWVPQAPSAGTLDLDDLTDVSITTPASGDRLRFDGSGWVNSPLRWEPHVSYDGTVVLDGIGNPVMHEVNY